MPPLIKLCGITSGKDAALAVAHEVDFAGFIFHPPSPRHMTAKQVAALDTGPAEKIRRVGVFVEQSAPQVAEILTQARLDMAQLAGDQSVEFCSRLGAHRVIRVFWPQRYKTCAALEKDLACFAGSIQYALLDAGTSGGGHGHSHDPAFLRSLNSPVPWFLAGGLCKQNLPHAMQHCTPDGFDFNSGLEYTPGKKDPEKVAQTLAILRTAL